MITEIVLFDLPKGTTREQAIATFRESAPKWQEPAELVRKYYLFDGFQAGGVYLWKSKDAARKWHGDAFRQRIRAVFGSEPTFTYYETPVIVDNVTREIAEPV